MIPKDLPDGAPSSSHPKDRSPRQTDDDATLAERLAQALYTLHQRGSYKELVLIAEPQTLRQIRDAMHETVEQSVVLSVSEGLTNHSLKDIAAALNKTN